jgi:hypothetical protein
MFDQVSFRLEHHNAILKALRALDGDLLLEAKCYFGGGTAIALALDEYRESVDIDFLCADRKGYRTLRSLLAGQKDLSGILRPGAELENLREVRSDQYGIRTALQCDHARIKFEIVRESRIDLSGYVDPRYGVPVLDRNCMYAEKLMANSDRWFDRAVMSRDIIDLSVMTSRWGAIPQEAWDIAEDSYGEKAREDYAKAIELIRTPEHMDECAQKLRIDSSVVDEILAQYGGPYPRRPSPFD